MSTTLLAAVLALPRKALPASSRHVLTALAWHCNERAVRLGTRECWPSLNTLANETGLDRTTCMRTIDVLAKRRFLEVDRRPRVGNRYRLTDPKSWPTRSMSQPAPGRTTQPGASGMAQQVSREQARTLLRKLAEQVGRRSQTGRIGQPQQEIRNSEQEPTKTTNNAEQEGYTVPRQRSREEQRAYVQAMMQGNNSFPANDDEPRHEPE